ncbi:MAG: cysteine--tRNA ligase [Proteobacteria bacterium]|nr:cysteine--tRNA ligase [Pseudomonadota bacterium]
MTPANHQSPATNHQTPIRLYNTMSRKLEEFVPLIPGHVGFYSCGPTVYWYQHLGNMRAAVHFDIIKRMFMANGYEVNHVMNITDVGHLTSDADTGEDKMEKGAKRENKSVWEIAQTYMDAFLRDTDTLNIIRPTHLTRATDHIKQQIELIQKLEALGYTYEIPGEGIYYDTSKFSSYGNLGGQDISKLKAGARIDDTGKKNPTDFALWKFSPKDEKRQMEWDSPWGVGFPGWHIECSAMSMEYLGPHFDVHAGGQEHIKVHHTNEIAQSEPIVGKPWVNYWIHHEWLMSKEGKMSKSEGEVATVPDLVRRGYDPMAFRYLLLTGHYKSPIEFSWAALDAAAAGYKNIVRKVAGIIETVGANNHLPLQDIVFAEWHGKILGAVSDNLKTATALVYVQELLADDGADAATKIALFEFIDRLLGLQFTDRAQKLLAAENAPVPDEIQKLADDRNAAKAAKDWARADEIRAQIDAAGWAVMDGKDGVKITKK